MKSIYAGKCNPIYGGCGATWNVDDEIEKNGLLNSNGKDAFCIHGTKCTGKQIGATAPQQTSGPAQTVEPITNEKRISFAEECLKSFIAICKEAGFTPKEYGATASTVYNTAIMVTKK